MPPHVVHVPDTHAVVAAHAPGHTLSSHGCPEATVPFTGHVQDASYGVGPVHVAGTSHIPLPQYPKHAPPTPIGMYSTGSHGQLSYCWQEDKASAVIASTPEKGQLPPRCSQTMAAAW